MQIIEKNISIYPFASHVADEKYREMEIRRREAVTHEHD